jgi:uncharacterized LabA/DUF88 family protein
VDGPNFISRLINFGLSNETIANKFSLNHFLINGIREYIKNEFGNPSSLGLEFIYSLKRPGPKGKKLSNDEWKTFIKRTSKENAVYLRKVGIESRNEKGVDIAVAMRMVEMANICEVICLVSSDNDYIPALEFLKARGKYLCTVGLQDAHPIDLINLSYVFIDITNYLRKQN